MNCTKPPIRGTRTMPYGLPTSTALTGTCAPIAFLTASAAVTSPPSCRPSVKRIIETGGTSSGLPRSPGSRGTARPTFRPVTIPSPSAVPPPGVSPASAFLTRPRFRVAGATTLAWVAKSTTPTRYLAGSWSANFSATCLTTSSRLGRRSTASIEREVSIAITIVAFSRLTVTSARGRAAPTSIVVRPTSSSATGTWRRQPGLRSITFGSSAGLVKRAAKRRRLRL